MDHLDGELVGRGQREEAPGELQQLAQQVRRYPMPGEIEKADIASRGTQLRQECARAGSSASRRPRSRSGIELAAGEGFMVMLVNATLRMGVASI